MARIQLRMLSVCFAVGAQAVVGVWKGVSERALIRADVGVANVRCETLSRCSYKPRQGDASFGALRLRGGSAPGASNFEEVGRAFVQHYYSIFDANRAGLQNLYQDVSMLTFEGEKYLGVQSIIQKLASLPFTTVKHEVVTVDSQPTSGGGVMVFACGNLKVDGSENPMKFSQVFCLQPLANGQGYFCYNDVFRLNLG